MSTETRHAICRFCHAMCAVKLTMEDGRVTGIIGDKDNPVYHGYSCVKGRNFHEFHYSPERVTRPVRRCADGTFAPVSLDRALSDIGDRLSAIIEQHG